MRIVFSICLLLSAVALPAQAKEDPKPAPVKADAATPPPYTQQMNVVYADTDDGIALVMDIFTPTGKKNGLAVIDVISGSWSAARGRLEDHKKAKMFDIICGRGYTVFAIRPGSVSKFTALEMLANLKTGIRWVKSHASEYGIDPDRLAICGASAGGHLASLAVTTAEDAKAKPKNELEKYDTKLKAAVIFFPPTDFIEWGGAKPKEGQASPVVLMLGKLIYSDGTKGHTADEINRRLEKISPARLVTGKECPCLLFHGTADPLVPLQQSQKMVEVLKKAGVPAELIIKEGGGHPWPTINEEVEIGADWMDKQLGNPLAGKSDGDKNGEPKKSDSASARGKLRDLLDAIDVPLSLSEGSR